MGESPTNMQLIIAEFVIGNHEQTHYKDHVNKRC